MSFPLRPLWKEITLLSSHERIRKQADILSLSGKAKQKIEWFIYYETKGRKNARRTARYFGIAPKTFYKWHAVFDPENLYALEEGSRAPIHRRKQELTHCEETRILRLRKSHPEFGKMKIQRLYLRIYQESVSSWKVQRVIEKYHLQRKRKERERNFRKNSLSRRKTIELQRKLAPGFLVAFDSIELIRNGRRFYIVSGIDTVTKIAWARVHTTHSSATTRDLFIRLYALTHAKILNVCQDNGSEFEKEFARAVASLNIPQYFSRVKTPKDNPVCERFNRTIKEEFLRMGNFTTDIHMLNRRLTKWLIAYNTIRPHQSLHYRTPFEYRYSQHPFVTDVSI